MQRVQTCLSGLDFKRLCSHTNANVFYMFLACVDMFLFVFLFPLNSCLQDSRKWIQKGFLESMI